MPIAEELAKRQKEISIAEFFERNRQILGFDNPHKAMITSVKEAVDNALDACEEAGILPEIIVKIENVRGGEYRITIEDNGPGIVKSQIPNVFARLLYGSRFHTLKQSRGQQGIGISAVVLYSQMTTGKPAVVTSKIGEGFPAHKYSLMIDTKKNLPRIIDEEMLHWDKKSGTKIEFFIKGKYVKNRKQSVYEYIRNTAIVNPHARIIFVEPDGTENVFERATETMPPQPKEIKPHPYGIELGRLMAMMKETKARKITSFLSTEFSSISSSKAKEIVSISGIDGNKAPIDIEIDEAKRLIETFKKVKFVSPPTDCLSPIGENLIRRGLRKETSSLSPEFIATDKRPPNVFSGTPFMVETGIVYGGNLPKEERVEILRFANKVPLLYQEGACVITEAIKNIDWRRYGLEQKGGRGIPYGPAIILVHVASVNIPFTSESKEAIAHIEEIEKEIRLSLQQCGRKLKAHISKKSKRAKAESKFLLITKLLPDMARKVAEILGKPVPSIDEVITQIMNIIWIEDEVRKGSGESEIKINVTNYTSRKQKFSLYAEISSKDVFVEATPSPAEIGEKYVKWDIDKIEPSENMEIKFKVREEMDDVELYIKGINPVYVIGAEKWEGD
ncbi:MAG: DNA topoisomerase VI subunit B [Thermoplasmata archaeon]|nr:DNA topoisomerase VI subunit B [Thermoplasmata archaeon]